MGDRSTNQGESGCLRQNDHPSLRRRASVPGDPANRPGHHDPGEHPGSGNTVRRLRRRATQADSGTGHARRARAERPRVARSVTVRSAGGRGKRAAGRTLVPRAGWPVRTCPDGQGGNRGAVAPPHGRTASPPWNTEAGPFVRNSW